MVANMSDDEIWRLNRGGHDQRKVYAAYDAAMRHKGQPTIILAKTVKGYGMGAAGEGQNTAHQQKKLDLDALKKFRDRFNIPVSDKDIEEVPYCKPAPDSAEIEYMHERRKSSWVASCRNAGASPAPLTVPPLEIFKTQLEGTGEREASTTMAFVRILTALVRDKQIGKHIVPIVPDEARTFGMEGMFRQVGIYSSKGQLYAEDADQLMFYREDKKGQILEEGINEAGAFCSWLAAGTSYSNHDTQTVPFYIYYSMFGFQRIGDFIWAGGDLQSRGFLIGGTAGRTTLAGEGLQHQDGHSLVAASTVPNCVSYDPTYAYELAVIVQDGLRRMIGEQEDVFYYITCMNENYVASGLCRVALKTASSKACTCCRLAGKGRSGRNLMGSGTILREVIGAAELLDKDFGIPSDVWSVTSFNELRRDALETERWNHLHPEETPKKSYRRAMPGKSQRALYRGNGLHEDQSRTRFSAGCPAASCRSVRTATVAVMPRAALRDHFEVDKRYIAITALKALADDGVLDQQTVSQAIEKYGIDPEKPDPVKL